MIESGTLPNYRGNHVNFETMRLEFHPEAKMEVMRIHVVGHQSHGPGYWRSKIGR